MSENGSHNNALQLDKAPSYPVRDRGILKAILIEIFDV